MVPTDQTTTGQERAVLAAHTAAKRLGLPLVRIDATSSEPAALKLIAERDAREFRLIPLTVREKRLQVALADPALLRAPAPAFLQALKSQQGYTLDLVITPPADLEAALAAYGGESGVDSSQSKIHREAVRPAESSSPTVGQATVDNRKLPITNHVSPPKLSRAKGDQSPAVPASVHSAQIPAIDLTIQAIDRAALERFPHDVATKYQMVVFQLSADGKEASVAAVNPDDRRVRDILKFVQSRNGVRIHLYRTDKKGLDVVLSQYEAKVQSPKSTVQSSSPKVASPTPPPDPRKSSIIPSTSLGAGNHQSSIGRGLAPVRQATTDRLKAAVRAPEPVVPAPAPPRPGAASVVSVPAGPVTPASPIAPVQTPTVQVSDITSVTAASAPAAPPPTFPGAITQLEEENLDRVLGGPVTNVKDVEAAVKSGIIPRTLAALVSLAVNQNASDIHVESGQDSVRVRYRVDGQLGDVIRIPSTLLAPLVSRVKILSKLKIDETRIPQDGRFQVTVASRAVDIRVSTLPTSHGEKVVMRLLDKSTGLKTVEQLGLAGTNQQRLAEMLDQPFGIILVTGPTGSGKTTTLYAMLQTLNKPEVNIVTLEDPIEYEIEGINQTQVRPKIGFGFADGLRSILRQDPNVIMVGEIRDRETAALAVQAALTGHLVLATLHTNNAAGAIPRLLDMRVEPYLLASALRGVVAQRLVRRLVPETRTSAVLPTDQQTALGAELAAATAPEARAAASQPLQFYAPGPVTRETPHAAYKGRVGLFEVMTVTDAIAALILDRAPAETIEDTALKEGMLLLRHDGLLKALAGETSIDEVLQATEHDHG